MPLILNTLTFVLGQPVTIVAGTITQPAGTDPALTGDERSVMIDALTDLYSGGTIEIWTAGMVTKVGEYTCNSPAYSGALFGSAELDVTGMTENALANGTAAIYRFVTSDPTNGRTGTVTT